MRHRFADLMFTPRVKEIQEEQGSRNAYARMTDGLATAPDALTMQEAEFIAARDSFYMATISETGWPYVQHRGGPVGFLKVIDERRQFEQRRSRFARLDGLPKSAAAEAAWACQDRRCNDRAGNCREAAGRLRGESRARHTHQRGRLRLELPAAHHASLHGGRDPRHGSSDGREDESARAGECRASCQACGQIGSRRLDQAGANCLWPTTVFFCEGFAQLSKSL